MDHPRPGLRYVDADDLDDSRVDFDGLDVESNTGEDLGDVDGFVIDINSLRPYYVVVDAGGWFTSKYILLPIGHVALDTTANKLIADVPRDRVKNYPGFDRDEFKELSDDDVNRLHLQSVEICRTDGTVDAGLRSQPYDTWRQYSSPTWWDSSFYRPDRADNAARSMTSLGSTAAAASMPSRDDVRSERDRLREEVVAKDRSDTAGDVSPHLGGRAQPGDVLGLETGGEQTHVGDTSEDENERRRDAEKDSGKK
jgi:hypothetical protein